MDTKEINIGYDKLEALYLNKEKSCFPKDIDVFEGKLGLISFIQEIIFNKSQ